MHTNLTVVRLEMLTLFPDCTRLTPPGIYKTNLERLRKLFNRVLLSTAKTHQNILNLRVGLAFARRAANEIRWRNRAMPQEHHCVESSAALDTKLLFPNAAHTAIKDNQVLISAMSSGRAVFALASRPPSFEMTL